MLSRIVGGLLILLGTISAIGGAVHAIDRTFRGRPGGKLRIEAQDEVVGIVGSVLVGAGCLIGGRALWYRSSTMTEVQATEPQPSNVQIELTARAAETARRIFREQGYPAGAALCIDATGSKGRVRYTVSYDDQPKNDRTWQLTASQGVPIMSLRRNTPLLDGLTVDFENDAFVFIQRARSVLAPKQRHAVL